MKNFLLILIAAVLINLANGVKYEEEDVYDDYELKERSYSEPEEKKLERPSLSIEDGPKLFKEFIAKYNREYKSEEETKQRYAYFLANLKDIIGLNNEGGSSVSAVNMFADYSEAELAALSLLG